NTKGCGFYALKGEKPGFYILTGREYLVFDGETVKSVSEDAYIPLVTIAKSAQGGGESYENINMLTPKRRENFIGTESDLIYQLGAEKIDSLEKVEILQQDGTRSLLVADTDYTADLTLGKITFVKAYPAVIEGEDNIFVTYSKTVDGYSEKITGCTICTQFGLGGENRIFLSGNSSCAHKDFWSEVYDPSYFADLNYSIIGNSQTAVMGYLKMGEKLGIVKQDNGQDTSFFIREVTQDSDGKAVFTLSSAMGGTGAVSKRCFAIINDEPLFLSSRGVFAVTSSVITSQKMIVNRSYQIDAKLTREENLENAVACVWKDFYIVSVNGNCYLLDTRQLVMADSGEKNSRYEAYFWDNVAANCFAVDNSVLWFGTKDGFVRRFKAETMGKECYSDDGRAIYSVWKTPVEDEGRIDRFKTLQRKGCLVTLKPFEASSCQAYCCIDGGTKQFMQKKTLDISPVFEKVDFTRFTFNTNSNPQEIYFYTRKKRYKRIQFVFENNAVNEGFGIQGITKLYKLGDYSKNRR
ncbi:MAG: hypothetical protein J6K80_07125, partial [Oscillospiraceae bacterium]|nr:hypothetical protein [Oscillospiraceae bacterium]